MGLESVCNNSTGPIGSRISRPGSDGRGEFSKFVCQAPLFTFESSSFPKLNMKALMLLLQLTLLAVVLLLARIAAPALPFVRGLVVGAVGMPLSNVEFKLVVATFYFLSSFSVPHFLIFQPRALILESEENSKRNTLCDFRDHSLRLLLVFVYRRII